MEVVGGPHRGRPWSGKRNAGDEFLVLLTTPDHEIDFLGELCLGRGDPENSFDKIKDLWGRGNLTAQNLHRCQRHAYTEALTDNRRRLAMRAAPKTRVKVSISRPQLMS